MPFLILIVLFFSSQEPAAVANQPSPDCRPQPECDSRLLGDSSPSHENSSLKLEQDSSANGASSQELVVSPSGDLSKSLNATSPGTDVGDKVITPTDPGTYSLFIYQDENEDKNQSFRLFLFFSETNL